MSKVGMQMVQEKRLNVITALDAGQFECFSKHIEWQVRTTDKTSQLHKKQPQ